MITYLTRGLFRPCCSDKDDIRVTLHFLIALFYQRYGLVYVITPSHKYNYATQNNTDI